MPIIEYGEKEISYLSDRDKVLGDFIKKCGFIERETNSDVFAFLVRSITAQQISNKAAASVADRLRNKFPEVTPSALLAASDEEIKSIGISMRKVLYIRGLCEAVRDGKLVIDELRSASDSEVEKKLITIKGIGTWTAEMTLIFSLGRKDVVSFGDFAVRKGMMKLYGLENLDRATFDEYRKRYSPYGTAASLYLWKAAVL